MRLCYVSDQYNHLWPFNEQRVPKFLQDKHNHIKSFGQASRYYQSLICFVNEGDYLDSSVTDYACLFLWYLSSASWYEFSPNKILYSLVPCGGSSSGFAESIVVILASDDKKLVKAALELLDGLWCNTSAATHFDILESGLFKFLPEYFYEEQMLCYQGPNKYMMKILTSFIKESYQDSILKICKTRNISVESFQQTFIDEFLEPIKPFLEFVCSYRREYDVKKEALIFSNLITTILESSPHVEPMTQFVLSSSSLALAYTDSLALFDASNRTYDLLQSMLDGVCSWRGEYPAVQKRGRRVVAKLREEGLSDEIELFLHSFRFSQHKYSLAFIAGCLIDLFGGNIPIRAN
ncbi:hypothetical protein BLNAU_10680 [Blattamonas nauphoetae]|uniref:Uncharacterized protein n=1 Tax=Blattamonas nauphoetae TaxID=2049346 RepID=A0ABQ9XRZ0_9EUKA|nr:hypothetical protein BLNAU_10680 [Blattamonas nauphoetae]